ncbi:HEAT repeat domain-containing protein [Geothrix fuzhouensis]|uniref:HEAT repeat domain-containing protein n=1 Tax=Geothrix fuzhouensis TaxID=2966451 RepID=UPI0027D2B766|nr:HEAT repeat domain-containing protein [Geothrix fuzhouensis]
MNDFLQLAQTLVMALKSLQMYTAAHPRAKGTVTTAHAALDRWLAESGRLQFVVTGAKAFVDGVVQDGRNPHLTTLVRLVSERNVSGFVFERGVTEGECLTFLQALSLKPQKLEEQGGIEFVLQAADVRHIKVSQVRYQAVQEGEEGPEDRTPASLPGPPQDPLVKAIREALLAALSGVPGPAGPGERRGLGFLRGFQAADLSGLGPLGHELGLEDTMPSPAQLGTLRQVLMGLEPDVQLSLLAGLASLPDHPTGLALGVKALAGEILSVAVGSALALGATWPQLHGPLEHILLPLPDREALVRTLVAHLRGMGLDATQAEALLHLTDWDTLSLEAKLVRVLEEDYLFELSLAQRLAFLRELLDLRRYDAFLQVQDLLLEALRDDRLQIRLKAAQTLAGVADWALAPGLPPDGEGPLAEALRAHFAWEPDPPVHRWTAEALVALLSAQIHRGELGRGIADLQELEGLCAFLDEPQPWRLEALDRQRTALARPDLLDAAANHILSVDRHQMSAEVQPYLEFLGAPMARHLVGRLGEEGDRTRRGRLVEALRSLGPLSLPPLLEVLASPAWYLVRNALTLLADLGDAGCLPAIAPLLRHPEPRVRRTAVRALWKLGGPASEPQLLARLKETDPETLHEILFALGQLRAESSAVPIAELAQDRRTGERLRIQAINTLGLIASPRSLPMLAELLRRRGLFAASEPQVIRLSAARALLALGLPEARQALQRVLDAEPKGETRVALIQLLAPPQAP